MTRLHSLLALAVLVGGTGGCAALSGLFGGKAQTPASAPAEPTPQERREQYLATHPELPDTARATIAKGALAKGMSTEQVTASVGAPRSREILIPQSPQRGDTMWMFQQIAFGKHTEFGDRRDKPVETRTFADVRDTAVRFWEGSVIGVDDLGITTRDQFIAACAAAIKAGESKPDVCRRLAKLDGHAASEPPA